VNRTPGTLQYERLKTALTDRFGSTLSSIYYYNLLHEIRQGRNESTSQFLDRCRAINVKTIRRSQDPIKHRILKEEANSRLLTSFIHGLRGHAGRELKFRTPNTVDEALSIAIVIYNMERVER
jgi:hypothetical protein